MIRSAHALQETCDRSRRAELANKVDVAYIDTELERCRGDKRAQFAGFQTLLGCQPLFARQAAMMRRDVFIANTFAEMARRSLGQPSGINKNQSRVVRSNQLRETVVNFLP